MIKFYIKILFLSLINLNHSYSDIIIPSSPINTVAVPSANTTVSVPPDDRTIISDKNIQNNSVSSTDNNENTNDFIELKGTALPIISSQPDDDNISNNEIIVPSAASFPPEDVPTNSNPSSVTSTKIPNKTYIPIQNTIPTSTPIAIQPSPPIVIAPPTNNVPLVDHLPYNNPIKTLVDEANLAPLRPPPNTTLPNSSKDLEQKNITSQNNILSPAPLATPLTTNITPNPIPEAITSVSTTPPAPTAIQLPPSVIPPIPPNAMPNSPTATTPYLPTLPVPSLPNATPNSPTATTPYLPTLPVPSLANDSEVKNLVDQNNVAPLKPPPNIELPTVQVPIKNGNLNNDIASKTVSTNNATIQDLPKSNLDQVNIGENTKKLGWKNKITNKFWDFFGKKPKTKENKIAINDKSLSTNNNSNNTPLFPIDLPSGTSLPTLAKVNELAISTDSNQNVITSTSTKDPITNNNNPIRNFEHPYENSDLKTANKPPTNDIADPTASKINKPANTAINLDNQTGNNLTNLINKPPSSISNADIAAVNTSTTPITDNEITKNSHIATNHPKSEQSINKEIKLQNDISPPVPSSEHTITSSSKPKSLPNTNVEVQNIQSDKPSFINKYLSFLKPNNSDSTPSKPPIPEVPNQRSQENVISSKQNNLSEEHEQFIKNETKMLLLPNDDVLLGKDSQEEILLNMDFTKYANLYIQSNDRNYNVARERIRGQDLKNFLNAYYPNKAKPIGSGAMSLKTAKCAAFNAVENNDLESLRTLLNNFPLLTTTNFAGDNLLHASIKSDNYAISKFLIMRGIDINSTNRDSQTPLALAESMNASKIAQFIKSTYSNNKF